MFIFFVRKLSMKKKKTPDRCGLDLDRNRNDLLRLKPTAKLGMVWRSVATLQTIYSDIICLAQGFLKFHVHNKSLN